MSLSVLIRLTFIDTNLDIPIHESDVVRRYMVKILPMRRKTLSNQSINQFVHRRELIYRITKIRQKKLEICINPELSVKYYCLHEYHVKFNHLLKYPSRFHVSICLMSCKLVLVVEPTNYCLYPRSV